MLPEPGGSALQGYPLSAWQRRICARPGRAGHSLELAVAVDGDLDAERLAAAVAAVGRRFEILRTHFRPVAGLELPLQVVGAEPQALAVGDAPSGDAPAIDPFAAPPAAVAWHPRAEGGGGTLILRAHPLVADGRSLRLWLVALAGELDPALAVAMVEGEEPLQYADFAAVLDEMAKGGELAESLSFWRQGPGAAVELAALRPLDGSGEVSGARTSVAARVLSPAVLAAPGDPALLALAALRLLVGRLTGAGDPAEIGVRCDLRATMGLDGALGPMSDWLPMPGALDGRSTWPAAMEAAAAELETLRSHQAARPLIEGDPPAIGFSDERSAGPLRVAGTLWQPGCVQGGLDGARLVFRLQEAKNGSGLAVAVEHGGDVDREAARDLLARWALLIESAAAEPGACLESVDLFLPGEARVLIDPAEDAALPALPGAVFERAASEPERPAVAAPGLSWSYGRLAAEVAAIARGLTAAGIGRGNRVALRFEPGPDHLASALAVWSVGAAWLPIDPDSPSSRVAFLLEDAGVDLLLHGPGLAAPDEVGVAALEVDPRREPAAVERDGFEPVAAGDDELAYLLYTSGSTGRPNGARLRHGGLRRYLRWVAREVLADCAALPATSRPTFDASLKQLFAPLLLGREVTFAPPGAAGQPALLLRFLAERPGSAINGVPSMVRALVDAAEDLPSSARPQLGAVLVGGAALPSALCRRIAALWPDAAIWNLYGLTEATANSLALRLEPGSPVTLGRPIAGARVAIVDAEGRPLPPLAEGELWVGGPGLADGYEGRPELDAERFAWLEADGHRERCLRTGDRGYRRPDGTIVFRGRRDDQLEVRGYRIERGEVEAALLALPGVAGAAVDRRDDSDGGHLIAWIEGPAALAPDTLRTSLARQLPAHLLPGRIVGLEALPRLPSGKVDRRALATWVEPTVPIVQTCGRPPESPLETAIAEVWAEVVGSPALGVDVDFFTVGGHSLLMARLARRLGERLEIEVPLAAALDKPTVAGLAALAERARAGGAGRRHLVALRATSRSDGGPACVFVHPSGGSVRAFYGILGELPEGVPVFALQSAGLAEPAAPLGSVEAMAAAYLRELAGIPEPWLLVGWSFGGLVAYEMARQRPEAVVHLVLLDSAPPDLLAARRRQDDEADHLLDLFGRDAPIDAGHLRGLPDRATRLEAVRQAGIAGGRFSPEIRIDELERYLQVYQANLAAGIAYEPDQGPAVAVTLVRAADETLWSDPKATSPPPPDLGWSRYLPSRPELRQVAGRHDTLFEPGFAAGVAKEICHAREMSHAVAPLRAG